MNRAIIVWILLSLIWGSTWIFIKLGLGDLPPFTFAGIRFLIASSILWVIVAGRRRPLPSTRLDWLRLAWTGLIAIAINYGLIFWGETRINSGLASVLQATIPAFGLIIAHFRLPGERITARRLAGVMIGISGVGLIFADQMVIEGKAALQGCIALLVSSICVAYVNVFVKANCQKIDSTVMAAGQMTFGTIPLLLAGAALEGNPFRLRWTPMALVSLGYLALVGSAVAFMLYYWMITKIEITRALLISLVIPVIALLIGWIVLGERITWTIAAGSLAIISGISLIIVQRRVKI